MFFNLIVHIEIYLRVSSCSPMAVSYAIINVVVSRIQAAEVRYFRAITGPIRRDRLTNTTIRAARKVERLMEKITSATTVVVWSCLKV